MLIDWLTAGYAWIKALHVVSVISWMAGMFYLPRLFVYHAERAKPGSDLDQTFQVMERRLMRAIMQPAMMATWVFGLMMVAIPGVVDWSSVWSWAKAVAVVLMTLTHVWLKRRIADFASGQNRVSGRSYRLANEIPTVLMLVIVFAVIVRPF
jgi:protoporphyrinogen IX oxidase